jgi:hypothetical protein
MKVSILASGEIRSTEQTKVCQFATDDYLSGNRLFSNTPQRCAYLETLPAHKVQALKEYLDKQ